MRKIILCISMLALSYSQVVAYNTTSGASNCTAISNTNGQKRVPVSNNTSAPGNGSLNCEWHGYYGGSWSGWRSRGTNASGNHYACPDDRFAAVIERRNSNTEYRIYCKYRDDDAPTISASALGGVIPANDSRRVNINYAYTTGGANTASPAGTFTATVERHDAPTAARIPVSLSGNGFNINVSNVDLQRNGNGYRPYTLRINNVCDAAGNCISGLPTNYTYDVYAAGIDSGNSSVSSLAGFTGNVADGANRNIQVRLEDQYGNEVVRVNRSPVTRTVTTTIQYNNSLYLDSYNNIGTSGVDINNVPATIGANQIYSLTDDSDGIYNFGFRTYAPTDAYEESIGTFGINSIYANASDIAGNTVLSVGTGFDFEPLYTTAITGEIVTQGFLEGALQTSNVQLLKTGGSSIQGTNRSLRTEFGQVSGANNVTNTRYDITLNAAGVAEGNQGVWSSTTSIPGGSFPANSTGNTPITTFMTQSGAVANQTSSYLASIVKYRVGGKDVIYPSAIVGKDGGYFGSAGGNNSYQEGIKIIGNTSSQGTGELVLDQFDDDVRILGKLTKSTFRRDISRNVYEVVRNVSSTNISGSVTDLGDTPTNPGEWKSSVSGERLFGNKVLLFRGNDINVGQNGVSRSVSGQKTLIVEDGDVYIKGNIVNDSQEDILGIIVLGGNIYIDATVTDVHAVLYTDKSILSSISGVPVTTSTNTASNLANQLYIKGSLFSENTIGGSRATPIQCPFHVSATCDTDEAQKYDLNYIRRYFIYDSDIPADGVPDTPSGLQSYAGTGTRGSRSDVESFPVVIEYNPLIQQTPPPFLD